MREHIMWVFSSMWPTILISSVVVIALRLYYIIKNHSKIILYNELIMFSFIIYIMCLFYVVTFPDDSASWSTSNFIPFKEMFRYQIGGRLFIKNVLGNLVMFIPLGFYISYILKIWKASHVFFLTLIVSLTIEITQLCIGRVFDIDDIILNVAGGLVGFFIYYAIHKIKAKYPKLFELPIVYNSLTIIGIIMLIYLAVHIIYI